MATIPVWIKDLIDRHNAHGDDRGIAGVLQHYALMMEVGRRLIDDTPNRDFLTELSGLVYHAEDREAGRLGQSDRAQERLRTFWRVALSEFYGFPVEVPPPPKLNRRQERALQKYRFCIMFLPSLAEASLPLIALRPSAVRLHGTEDIPLPGRWVAVEAIHAVRGGYEDDRLMADLGLASRRGFAYAGSRAVPNVLTDVLPKAAERLGFPGEDVEVSSLEEWLLAAALFNWLRIHRGMAFPNLTVMPQIRERCRNGVSILGRLFVFRDEDGDMKTGWRSDTERVDDVAFRLVVGLR